MLGAIRVTNRTSDDPTLATKVFEETQGKGNKKACIYTKNIESYTTKLHTSMMHAAFLTCGQVKLF